MVDKKKFIQKKLLNLENIFNHYSDKRNDIMKKSQINLEDILSDTLGKDSILPEQITKRNIFQTKMM